MGRPRRGTVSDHDARCLITLRQYADRRWTIGGVIPSHEGPIYFEEEMGPFDGSGELSEIVHRLSSLAIDTGHSSEVWRQLSLF